MRETINEAETRARTEAIKDLLANEDLMIFLEKLYPNVRNVLSRAEEFTSFFLLDLVSAITTGVFPETNIREVSQLESEIKLALCNFFLNQICNPFERKLINDNRFQLSIRELGQLTAAMYNSAIASL